MKHGLAILVCLLASGCSPKGKAICDCTIDGSYVAIYTMGHMSLAQADSNCKKIQRQWVAHGGYKDTCWAFVDY
jgi:hypothetical protein